MCHTALYSGLAAISSEKNNRLEQLGQLFDCSSAPKQSKLNFANITPEKHNEKIESDTVEAKTLRADKDATQ